MKRLAASLAAVAVLALPVPLHAQAPLTPEAEESLKCAIWASYYSVAFEGQEEAAAFGYALSYFVGRYEGITGLGIDKAVDERLIVDTANSIDALSPACSARMEAYGTRMVDWGAVLNAIASQLPADEPPVPAS